MVEKRDDVNGFREQVQAVISKQSNGIPSKDASLIEDTLVKMLDENLSLKEALGFSNEMIEEIYEHGYHLFQSGKYTEALSVFNLLRQLDGSDPRLTFAIAACHHQTKNYIEAAGHYMLCETLDQHNPLPYYHLYDCFTKMDQPELAANALKVANRLAGEDARYAELKSKIEVELRNLNALESHSERKPESTAA